MTDAKISDVAAPPVGFVGLGNMGQALACNLVEVGFAVVAHDALGPGRAPAGVLHVDDVAAIAVQSKVIVLSLPDGDASASVVRDITETAGRMATHIVDTSTIGVEAAQAIAGRASGHGIAYVDAPVSGGVAGARARTLAVMYAAADDACASVMPVIMGLSDQRYRVGERPGLAQAMKLANNFLSATALAATSEAVAFGQSMGLDMGTMLEVLNGSSGRSAATSDKFPNHVVTGRYASGFSNTLMAKDLALYRQAEGAGGSRDSIGAATAAIWDRFAAASPGVDFTMIFPFVAER